MKYGSASDRSAVVFDSFCSVSNRILTLESCRKLISSTRRDRSRRLTHFLVFPEEPTEREDGRLQAHGRA